MAHDTGTQRRSEGGGLCLRRVHSWQTYKSSRRAATLGIGLGGGVHQNKADHRAVDLFAEDRQRFSRRWEAAPAEVDCQTRQPQGPTIRSLLTFNRW